MHEPLKVIEKENYEIGRELVSNKKISVEQKAFRRGRIMLLLDLLSIYEEMEKNIVREDLRILRRIWRYQEDLERYLEAYK